VMSGADPPLSRQDEILDRTIELIRDSGMSGLTMKKVAERVGFTEPAIYRYFPTKQALLIGVAGRLGGRFLGPVRAIDEQLGLSPLEKIERMVAHHIGLIVDSEGLPILLLAEAQASGEEALARKMGEIAGTYLQTISRLAGEIALPPGAPPPGQMALPLMGLAAAVALQRRLMADRRMSREEALEMARFVVRRLFQEEEKT
jgi:AcrR family transcriptional regulator